MDKLAVKIAGEIALSESPGETLKKWREIFGITQVSLGRTLGISPSTISDYEGNRRKSPGIATVRRFVSAMLQIDSQEGGTVAKRFSETEAKQDFFSLHEFPGILDATEFAKLIEAKAVANEELLAERKLHGYTIIDSIKVILELPYPDFHKVFGASSERALIFTNVSTGRSPMVVLRITPIKPSVAVLHNIDKVDKLALKIAELEKIPLLTTKLEINDIVERLKKYEQ